MPGQVLLVLPILKRRPDHYEATYQRVLAAKRAELERQWNRPLAQVPPEGLSALDRVERYREWIFNDVAGYLEIAIPEGRDVPGYIYLKRRCFPRRNREHVWSKPSQSQEVLFFTDIKTPVYDPSNPAYAAAVAKLAAIAQCDVREMGCGTRDAFVQLPPIGLEYIDFVQAIEVRSRTT